MEAEIDALAEYPSFDEACGEALVDYATLIGGMTLAEEILERARKRLHR